MQITAACDEDTIGVAAILGTTYTGAFDDVATIDTAVGALPQQRWQAHARLDVVCSAGRQCTACAPRSLARMRGM